MRQIKLKELISKPKKKINQRVDRTLFLEKWVGFGGVSNLSDLELQLKYA